MNDISKRIHEKGVHVFALGIGSTVRQAELQVMASRNNHVLYVPTLAKMENFAANLARDICLGTLCKLYQAQATQVTLSLVCLCIKQSVLYTHFLYLLRRLTVATVSSP